nr:hypothetical protein [Tanacetum cinerariifolium]
MDVQMARQLEEEMARDAKRMNEQIAMDAKIAMIHVEEELQMMIDGLDRSNEMIAKHLHEYEQAAAEQTIGEKIELINELVKYQDHHSKILKLEQESLKKVKISEEVSEEDLKKMMQLVPVEEVYVEAYRGYKYHPLHVVSYPLNQILTDLSYVEEPEDILDRQDRVMRNKTIPFVKILWRNHPEWEATWETEESIRTSYPHSLP